MAISLNFFMDSSLTQPLGTTLPIDREIGGAPVDVPLWLGSSSPSRVFSPSTDAQITVSVLDTSPADGWAAGDITLALTQSGLATATPAAPLPIAAQINSGIQGAVSFWLRFNGQSATPKTASDLQLITNAVKEYSL